METNDTAKVVMVPVKRYDINLTLDDILTPLTKTVDEITAKNLKIGAEAAPHLLRFHELVTQLHEVVTLINRIDPSLLASRSTPVSKE